MARSNITIDEIAHQSPIRTRAASAISSSRASSAAPIPRPRLAATPEAPCAFMFHNMRRTVEAGGATGPRHRQGDGVDGGLQRAPVNHEWVKMFPDPASRPARQIMETPMEAGVAHGRTSWP